MGLAFGWVISAICVILPLLLFSVQFWHAEGGVSTGVSHSPTISDKGFQLVQLNKIT
jgi:hypothetical protein